PGSPNWQPPARWWASPRRLAQEAASTVPRARNRSTGRAHRALRGHGASWAARRDAGAIARGARSNSHRHTPSRWSAEACRPTVHNGTSPLSEASIARRVSYAIGESLLEAFSNQLVETGPHRLVLADEVLSGWTE